MQSRAIGGAIAVGLVVVAVVLFVVLSGDDGDDDTASTTATTTTQAEKTSNEKKQKPKLTTIVVEGGEPVGGVEDLTYKSGDDVQFQVEADAPAEVHVHGYDIMKDVEPGKAVKFDFAADIEGGFEVELEETATQIAELTVEPA